MVKILKPRTVAQNVDTNGPASRNNQRIFVEDANGLRLRGGGSGHLFVDVTDKPFPTVQANRSVRYYIENDGKMTKQRVENKPPYQVPLMTDIAALPWNGFTAISTFSGCGGSCLGYRMAGFKVLWASEFIPAAQEVYRLNHPGSILDTRDIRAVEPGEILEAIGLKAGELDLMDGSPPCASFSTAGKREAGWGKVKNYSDTKQRTDDLFFEYARILNGLQPKVFVAENVSGLVKGTAKGYFKLILQELKDCGYNVKAKLLDAQWLGVPQMRQRIIFIGVRNDLGLEPVYPKPLTYRYSVREAIPWIVRQGDNGGFGGGGWQDAGQHPSGTIGTGAQAGNGRFPPALVEAQIKQGGKNGHSSQRGEIDNLAALAPTIIAGGGSGQFEVETRAYRDKRGAFGNDGDITDQPAPTVLSDSIGTHWVVEPESGWNAVTGAEREFGPNDVVPTIMTHGRGQSGLVYKAGLTEKRKFTIAELKRICAFPDDFQLTGTYSQQWERLGRAVPPVMMAAVAQVIRDEILCKLK
jgi:DNA (cytosine-5)-methyltransferase 1